jgi:hypothetical protein
MVRLRDDRIVLGNSGYRGFTSIATHDTTTRTGSSATTTTGCTARAEHIIARLKDWQTPAAKPLPLRRHQSEDPHHHRTLQPQDRNQSRLTSQRRDGGKLQVDDQQRAGNDGSAGIRDSLAGCATKGA